MKRKRREKNNKGKRKENECGKLEVLQVKS
jgi:hypothetical protein